jgi:hypothetical protein
LLGAQTKMSSSRILRVRASIFFSDLHWISF